MTWKLFSYLGKLRLFSSMKYKTMRKQLPYLWIFTFKITVEILEILYAQQKHYQGLQTRKINQDKCFLSHKNILLEEKKKILFFACLLCEKTNHLFSYLACVTIESMSATVFFLDFYKRYNLWWLTLIAKRKKTSYYRRTSGLAEKGSCCFLRNKVARKSSILIFKNALKRKTF
jgi:hypothetical protein